MMSSSSACLKTRMHLLDEQLFEAVTNDDLKRVKESISLGANVNTEQKIEEYGNASYTPLILASENNFEDVVRQLLQSPSIDVNKRSPNVHTALAIASQKGHIETVDALLEHKDIDVNLVSHGSAPLHTASANGYTEVVEVLLKTHGILVNIKDTYQKTALHKAASAGWLETVKLLLDVPGISVNEKEYVNLHTPLHLAADSRYPDIVEALLNHPDIDVNAKDKYGQTALHTSAYYGDSRTVKMLLAAGIDVETKTIKDGFTAVYFAGSRGHRSVVEMITKFLRNAGQTPSDLDSMKRQLSVVTKCMKRMGTAVKPRETSNSQTNAEDALLLEAAKNGDLEKIEELVKQPGIDINSMDHSQNTPLHLASKKGHAKIVKVLLGTKGIDVNARNKDNSRALENPHASRLNVGQTALYLAVQAGHLEVVSILVNHPEVDVNLGDKYGKSPLNLAVLSRNSEIVEMLFKRPEVDVNSKYGIDNFTPLLTAAERGSWNIVKMLAHHPRIDVNLKDTYYKCTPLHMAVRRNNLEAVEAILSNPKVDVDAKDKFSNTPLHNARSEEIVERLLKAGANPKVKNNMGKTPQALHEEKKFVHF